jgi:hypothetical protein
VNRPELGWGSTPLESFCGFGASDPDDLAVLLSAALNAAGVEHHVVLVVEGKFVKAIELRKGKRGENGPYIARVACGPADIGAANEMLLERAIEEAGKL